MRNQQSHLKKKILIVRFSSIGDIILTTPVIRCLKLQLNAEIHFVTKAVYRNIIVSNPYLDKVWIIRESVNEIKSELKTEQFDYIIDLHKNLRTLQLRLFLGVKTLAFDKLNFQKWLIVNLKINQLPKIHIVDRYLESVKSLGIVNDGKGLDYFIPEKDIVNLSKILPFKNEAQSFIAFVIGAAHATKRLPTDKVIRTCQKLKLPVVLLGGPEDAENGQKIAAESGMDVHNLCGKLNLNQSASVLQQAAKVITHDTGLMHIAAAFKKEIISIWGNTIPDFGMYPYVEKEAYKIIEIQNLACRPCSKIGYNKCPKGHFDCMNKIDEESIIKVL